jgi:hypothetical protein
MTYSHHAWRQDGLPGPGGPEHCMTPVPSRALSSVKRQLTPDGRRQVTENDEYAAFLRRVLRAYGRRIAAGDIDALVDMAAMADELESAMRLAVAGLRRVGYSWGEIAVRLGITRQGAQQRWGQRTACDSSEERLGAPGKVVPASESDSTIGSC